jgi:hypothetical protein
MHYLVRHHYPSIEKALFVWCGMLSGNCVLVRSLLTALEVG